MGWRWQESCKGKWSLSLPNKSLKEKNIKYQFIMLKVSILWKKPFHLHREWPQHPFLPYWEDPSLCHPVRGDGGADGVLLVSVQTQTQKATQQAKKSLHGCHQWPPSFGMIAPDTTQVCLMIFFFERLIMYKVWRVHDSYEQWNK